MLFKFGPDELRFIMVDPKVVEMQMYNSLPHLVVPVVTDPKKTVAALKWVVNEMEKRYRIFAKEGVRNFDGFNNRPKKEKPVPARRRRIAGATEVRRRAANRDAVSRSHQAPPWSLDDVDDEQIESIASALESGELGPEADEDDAEFDPRRTRFPTVSPTSSCSIDELADLMQTAPADVEMCIARIAQKARAAGIHLIIATQTPRADVVTGIIKANIPCRIAFQVSSALDSRVILDTKGADKLVGKGDMLYLPPGSAKLERAQGAFVTDAEIERIIDHCAAQGAPKFETDIHASLNSDESRRRGGCFRSRRGTHHEMHRGRPAGAEGEHLAAAAPPAPRLHPRRPHGRYPRTTRNRRPRRRRQGARGFPQIDREPSSAKSQKCAIFRLSKPARPLLLPPRPQGWPW